MDKGGKKQAEQINIRVRNGTFHSYVDLFCLGHICLDVRHVLLGLWWC